MTAKIAPGSRSTGGALVVYDGECIFCLNYVRMLRLKDSVGHVDLIDARSEDARVGDLVARGYDLDEGMVFVYQDRIYHGHQAVQAIALLASSSTLFNRVNAKILSRPTIARLSYPLLKAGRRVTLWVRGRTLIGKRAKLAAHNPRPAPDGAES